MFNRKSILRKTMEMGGCTLLSRCLGIIREALMVRYLGANAFSDAFLTAFKIPNSLRKIFAEGAVSAAFVPTIVQTMDKHGRGAVNALMTLGLLVIEGIVLVLCGLMMWHANWVIASIAPGFSADQIAHAIPYLQVLMPFIFFLSSSALFGGAFQSVGHFFVPSFSPVLLNVVFIIGLLTCLSFHLPVLYLCFFILFGGFLQFLWHCITYVRLNFWFASITKEDTQRFWGVLGKFLLCLPSISIMELALFIDTSFASYLPAGSISLIYYANRFVGIPNGVFGVAFSTILLPHLSRVSGYAPRRLAIYLLEAAKMVLWVTLPVALVMGFFADKIFITIFLSKKFTLDQVAQASMMLRLFLGGLFFFMFNKILLNMYYALHNTWIPACIAAGATAANVLLNWILMPHFGAMGLVSATVFSAVVQSVLLALVLVLKFNFRLYTIAFAKFAFRYGMQVGLFTGLFGGLYWMCLRLFIALPLYYGSHLISGFGLWLWVGPLCAAFAGCLWYTRRWFGVQLYFLD